MIVVVVVGISKLGKTDNFQSILANVQKNVPRKGSAKKETAKESPGKKLIINDFIVKKGKVNLAVEMPGGVLGEQEIKADLPDIHLKDIGKKKGGASAAEVASEIVTALYGEIQSPVVMNALKEQISSLGGAPAKAAEQALKGAGGVVEGAGEGAGSVTDKVKGLFKKKK